MGRMEPRLLATGPQVETVTHGGHKTLRSGRRSAGSQSERSLAPKFQRAAAVAWDRRCLGQSLGIALREACYCDRYEPAPCPDGCPTLANSGPL